MRVGESLRAQAAQSETESGLSTVATVDERIRFYASYFLNPCTRRVPHLGEFAVFGVFRV